MAAFSPADMGVAAKSQTPERHVALQLVPTIAYDALVLDARLRQALVSVRSLGKRGLAVAALETLAGVPTFYSRWCCHVEICPREEGSEGYAAYLEELLDRTDIRVLIPSSDGTIALLRRHRPRLEQRTRIALAPEPALAIAVNKEQTLAIAQRIGLGVPRGVVVGSPSDVAAALSEIALPAVVKPVESWVPNEPHGTRKVSRLVTTREEAHAAVDALAAHGGRMLFQQYLPGRREAVSFLLANGTMHARFAQWAKRTEPPLGGQSVLRQSIALPQDIGGQAERLVREIELQGYSEVEFRRDAAGKPYLMEINPRLSASVELAVRAGVDFPLLIYQWVTGERIDTVEGYRTGGWMRYLRGDFMTTIAAIQQRGRPGVAPPAQAVLGFCLSFLRPAAYDYIDWQDLRPALAATSDFARTWILATIMKRLRR